MLLTQPGDLNTLVLWFWLGGRDGEPAKCNKNSDPCPKTESPRGTNGVDQGAPDNTSYNEPKDSNSLMIALLNHLWLEQLWLADKLNPNCGEDDRGVEDIPNAYTSMSLKAHGSAREAQCTKSKWSAPVGKLATSCSSKRALAICPRAKCSSQREPSLDERIRHEPSPLPWPDMVTEPSAESTKQEAQQRREGLRIGCPESSIMAPIPLFSSERIPFYFLGDGRGPRVFGDGVRVLGEQFCNSHSTLNRVPSLESGPYVAGGVSDSIRVSGHETIRGKWEASHVDVDFGHEVLSRFGRKRTDDQR